MKRTKRTAAVICGIIMTVFLANCNRGGTEKQVDTAVVVPSAEKPVTLTIMHKLYGDERYLGSDNINNNAYTREYVKQTGFQLNYTIAASQNDYNQKLTMAIASNDLPDLLELPAKEFTMLAEAGRLADITGVFEQYASPLLKETITADGGIQLQSARVNGKLYGIPQPNAADSSVDLLWIRTDWLKKLNLSPPKTIDDLINIARAFKNRDPDGNGRADTFGIGFQKNVEDGGAGTGSFEGFFGAYGAYTKAWLREADGKIAYSGIRPGIKTALAKLHEMYAEGLIDPEFGVKDSVKVNEDIAAGKIGMVYGKEGLPWGPLKDNIVNSPSADWECFAIVPADTNGRAVAMTYVVLERYFAVNAKCKYPQALPLIANIFQEKINSIDSTLEILNEFGVDPQSGINIAAYAAFGMDPSVQKTNTYYREIKGVYESSVELEDIHPEAIRYYTVMKDYSDTWDKGAYPVGWNYYKFIGPVGAWHVINTQYKDKGLLDQSLFFGNPTKTMSTKRAALEKLQSETFVNIITGSQPLSSFDTYVSTWKSTGGDEITVEVNDWYSATFGE